MEHIDVAVIGGGDVGLATTYLLSRQYPAVSVAVFEKNKYLAEEQSGRNSGVDHSRYQHRPETLKSRLRSREKSSLQQFCEEHNVPYERVGKLIVARTPDEVGKLDRYETRACAAGVTIERLTQEEVKAIEPNVEAQAALYTPTTGVVDAAAYSHKLETLITRSENAYILQEAHVSSITPEEDGFIIDVTQRSIGTYSFKARVVINAAGLYADEVARMINPDFPYRIRPVRGEYCKFNRKTRPELWLNGTNVYPVPQDIPGMFDELGEPKTMAGTHLTPTFDLDAQGNASLGNMVIVGPLGRVVADKADYKNGRRPREDFYDDIRKMFPGITPDDLEEDFAGIQAKIDGYDDWVIEPDKKYPMMIHALCDSPGMSGSLDIAKYIVEELFPVTQKQKETWQKAA